MRFGGRVILINLEVVCSNSKKIYLGGGGGRGED